MFISEKDHIHVEYKSQALPIKTATTCLKLLERHLVYMAKELTAVHIMGKIIDIPRNQVAYGDGCLKYSFSGTQVATVDWNSKEDLPENIAHNTISRVLKKIRNVVEAHTGNTYNFVLINRYKDGSQYIGFHSDDEKEIDQTHGIVGISLGAERNILFKANTKKNIPTELEENLQVLLEHGSLVYMKHPTNQYWKHSIPKKTAIKTPRISLTFRKIVTQNFPVIL